MMERLSEKLGLPVIIENDTNAAAWGEYVCRQLDSKLDLLFVSLGTGLGGGLILEGKVRRGINNSAGEIGYMLFDRNYKVSNSEPGWLENHINFSALTKRWSCFPDIIQNSTGSIKDVRISKEEMDQLVDFIAENLALCIANIVSIADIPLVVLGGITVKALGTKLIDRVKNYLSEICLNDVECFTQQCEEPGVAGAASIVTAARLKDILEG